MTKSLQQIEDYYLSQGLKGEELRNTLEKDNEYQELLKERKVAIRDKYSITKQEEKGYVLPNEEDYEILSLVKTLESRKLPENDREIVELIKTQLEAEWRQPLLDKLKQLLQKYS
ncbi:hypothetical protein HY404_01835 [Candidatus Microgenomates bacterium]|nr:hypothetical protein [Candidatus Microgenomates bacterium]